MVVSYSGRQRKSASKDSIRSTHWQGDSQRTIQWDGNWDITFMVWLAKVSSSLMETEKEKKRKGCEFIVWMKRNDVCKYARSDTERRKINLLWLEKLNETSECLFYIENKCFRTFSNFKVDLEIFKIFLLERSIKIYDTFILNLI